MKKYFYYAMVAMMMNIPFTGCSSEDSNVNEPLEEYGNFIESVEEQSGIIHYDEQLSLWYIYQVGGNTGNIDNVIKYFPTNLSKDFQEEGITVSFSGKLYESKFTIPQIGGLSHYVIVLTSINKKADTEEYGDFIGSVEEQSGTIYYDEQLHMWYIYQVGGNTGIIDSVIKYFPINLSKDFQEEGLTVSFSGKLYTPEFTIPQIGGVSYYVIELSLMSRQGQDIL